MVQKFKTLFDLTVKHTYYTSGYANDFVFSPTAQTAKDLSRYKLLARQKHAVNGSPEAYGLKVNYSEVDGAPLIPITAADSPSLVFGLNLKNTRFLNITNETELPAFSNQECWYCTNVGVIVDPDINLVETLSLNRTPIKLRRKVFELNFSITVGSIGSATIKIFNESNDLQAAYNQSLTNAGGKYEALIDLNGLDDGIYFVEIRDGASALVSNNRYYISDELTAMKPMAILDLRLIDNTQLRVKKLEINFTARSVKWKYWVVLPEGEDPLNYSIDTTATTPSIGGVAFPVPLLTPDSLEELTLFSLEAQYAGREIVLFESDTTIALNEAPIKGIKLKKDPSSFPVKHLPGMPVDSPKTEAYIFI